ncbi:unnamed protein product [Adineta ricciae]|uniref:Uncharacterized protein n=1 Tax=Adineta ricciae TaxID=249248 RepID=A0A815E407_ADIRI|nr:unnamed protein product [Adineta ricciae]
MKFNITHSNNIKESIREKLHSKHYDRSDLPTNSKDQTSLSMDPNNQYPTTTTDLNNSPPNLSTIPKQSSTEIATIDRQGKYAAPMIDRERVESETDRRRFDVKRYVPSALRAQDKSQPPAALLDPRFYSMKKTAMTILCLLIIVMSNSVQLKHVLSRSTSSTFYGTQVTLGIVSILMCASIGVILMYVMRIDINDQYKQHKLDYIDNCVICLLFILAIFNIFIAACS